MSDKNEKIFEDLSQKIDELSIRIEKLNLAEYLEILRDPKKVLYVNFLGGIARGFGMAVGFTLLGAFVIYILQRMVILKLPIIGTFIADIVEIVQKQISIR
ncbi:conserved protein of unknown function [Tepidanaerobacter acetatoxydans Re1]|uniref:Uncharacterized protein n=1 Tax=Tepidanaerobacter acetatoxydans (strain DSM 21804 / JCM 16047 / Re1) TaxID=1209989 RepID=F4LVP0_TEPAE|nr:DUF5665 domain-containing protein [Tepidanaerobacter acetatoxydans]AEE91626.1 hypothetical protein TepRe1_1480 [Tepidanaerobacter acetatoxydans Re1]CDI40754.1 conserved protein of unknown function [Tepidanaerobacter acetatoxydans Re1]